MEDEHLDSHVLDYKLKKQKKSENNAMAVSPLSAPAHLRPPHTSSHQLLGARRMKKPSDNTRQEDGMEELLEDVPGVDLRWSLGESSEWLVLTPDPGAVPPACTLTRPRRP
jgi:hypothetical protein